MFLFSHSIGKCSFILHANKKFEEIYTNFLGKQKGIDTKVFIQIMQISCTNLMTGIIKNLNSIFDGVKNCTLIYEEEKRKR